MSTKFLLRTILSFLFLLLVVSCNNNKILHTRETPPIVTSPSINATTSPVSKAIRSATDSISSTLSLPVLPSTPVPMPNEPITLDNVDQIQELAIWGKGGVTDVAYSPDGRLLVMVTTDGLWFYDATTRTLLDFIETNMSGLTFTPYSQDLITWRGSVVSTWDVTTKKATGHLDVGETYEGRMPIVSSNGATVAALTASQTIEVWDTSTQEIMSILEYTEPIREVEFSLDGSLLAAQTEADTILVWEVSTGTPLAIVAPLPKTPDSKRRPFALSHDNTLLAVGNTNGEIQLWSLQTGALFQTLPSTTSEPYRVLKLQFSPDSAMLAAGQADGSVRLWTVETGTPFQTLAGHETPQIHLLFFSPDSSLLISGVDENTLAGWNVANGDKLYTLSIEPLLRFSVVFSPDGDTIAIVDTPAHVKLWDAQTGVSIGPLNELPNLVVAQAIGPDGTIFATYADQNIYLRDVNTGGVGRTLAGHGGSLALSADGTTLASEGWGLLKIWDVQSGQVLQSSEWPQYFIRDLALSPNGNLLARAERSSGLPVYDLRTGDEPRVFGGHTADVDRVLFSPDGRLLASASLHTGNHTAILWDVETGELRHRLDAGIAISTGMAFSPDNQTIAISYKDGSIRLWDVETGQIQRIFEEQVQPRGPLTFSVDGTILAASSGNTVQFWDVATGRLLHTLDEPPLIQLGFIGFMPDNRMLVTGSRVVRLWGLP